MKIHAKSKLIKLAMNDNLKNSKIILKFLNLNNSCFKDNSYALKFLTKFSQKQYLSQPYNKKQNVTKSCSTHSLIGKFISYSQFFETHDRYKI